eukprot:m.21464 g.21464  ORF g.21464 m.21464 type:complete len:316 (+) comp5353_c0_seq1:3-950(+)
MTSLSLSKVLAAPSSSILVIDEVTCPGVILFKQTLESLQASGKHALLIQAANGFPLLNAKNTDLIYVPWNESSPSKINAFFQECLSIVQKRKCIVCIDSISALTQFCGGNEHQCIRFIQLLQQVDGNVAVFGVLHKQCFGAENEAALCHLFHTQITLSLSRGNISERSKSSRKGPIHAPQAVAQTIHMKRGGKTASVKEFVWFNIATGKILTDAVTNDRYGVAKAPENKGTGNNEDIDDSNDPTANLTFSLSLSDQEKAIRANTVLPYMKTSEHRPTLSTTPVTKAPSSTRGVIYYEPDEVDDFDDEDPDDDLDL